MVVQHRKHSKKKNTQLLLFERVNFLVCTLYLHFSNRSLSLAPAPPSKDSLKVLEASGRLGTAQVAGAPELLVSQSRVGPKNLPLLDMRTER